MPRKFHIDSENNGLENLCPFTIWQFWWVLVSRVHVRLRFSTQQKHWPREEQQHHDAVLGARFVEGIIIPEAQIKSAS